METSAEVSSCNQKAIYGSRRLYRLRLHGRDACATDWLQNGIKLLFTKFLELL
jgi:hypothetical protein